MRTRAPQPQDAGVGWHAAAAASTLHLEDAALYFCTPNGNWHCFRTIKGAAGAHAALLKECIVASGRRSERG